MNAFTMALSLDRFAIPVMPLCPQELAGDAVTLGCRS